MTVTFNSVRKFTVCPVATGTQITTVTEEEIRGGRLREEREGEGTTTE